MTELTTEYLDGALPFTARLAARWHLAWCRACRIYFDQIGKTRRLLRGLPLGGPSEEVEERLLAARAQAHEHRH